MPVPIVMTPRMVPRFRPGEQIGGLGGDRRTPRAPGEAKEAGVDPEKPGVAGARDEERADHADDRDHVGEDRGELAADVVRERPGDDRPADGRATLPCRARWRRRACRSRRRRRTRAGAARRGSCRDPWQRYTVNRSQKCGVAIASAKVQSRRAGGAALDALAEGRRARRRDRRRRLVTPEQGGERPDEQRHERRLREIRVPPADRRDQDLRERRRDRSSRTRWPTARSRSPCHDCARSGARGSARTPRARGNWLPRS